MSPLADAVLLETAVRPIHHALVVRLFRYSDCWSLMGINLTGHSGGAS